jgi:hypothetical protein
MAHEVRVKIDTAVVENKDLEVLVKTDGRKLGTLLISKGNVEWRPKGNSVNKKRFTWAKFAELMEEYGKPAKVK